MQGRTSERDSSHDDDDSARERQLAGTGREEPRTRADDYAAACQAGRSCGRSWLAASSNAEASVVRPPVDEAKRWASGKGRKVGFAKARATFRGGGTGIAANK